MGSEDEELKISTGDYSNDDCVVDTEANDYSNKRPPESIFSVYRDHCSWEEEKEHKTEV